MAINKNKVQLQETTLDSNGHPLSSTDVNPLTSSDCVIMENGMTLEDVMGNDTVATPTIMNEDTSFKAGIGDSEAKVIDGDVAKMVIEGKTYQNILPKPTTLIMNTDEKEFKINDKIDSSIILDDNIAEIATIKGQTYVNTVQEESASEYVAIDEELNGQSITTTGKPEGYVKNATLEGLTLVNTIQEHSGADATVLDLDTDIDAQTATINNTVQGGIHGAKLNGMTLVNMTNKAHNILIGGGSASEVTNATLQVSYSHTKSTATVVTGGLYNAFISLRINGSLLKPSTSYFVRIGEYKNSKGLTITEAKFKETSNTISTFVKLSNNTFKVTTKSEFTTGSTYTIVFECSKYNQTYEVGDSWSGSNIIVCEYQDGMENWDIPYFEGMKSVKLPVLTTVGKNLLDVKKFNFNDNSDFTLNGNTITCNYTKEHSSLYLRLSDLNLKPNTTYRLSANCSANVWIGGMINHDSSWKWADNISSSITFTTPNNLDSVLLTIKNISDLTSATISNIQIEESTTATSYEPYKSSTLTTPSDVVLRKVGDVQDELDLLTGEVTENLIEVSVNSSTVLNGYAQTIPEHTNTSRFMIHTERTFGVDIENNYGLSDKIPYKQNDDDDFHFKIGNMKNHCFIYVPINELETNDWDGFVKWAKNKDFKMILKRSEKLVKTVDLSIVDQNNNTLSTIQTHPTLTHVSTSSQGLIPFVSIPSQLKYPTIIKPSTTYTVQLKHTTVNSEFPLTINLGGTVIAVPSTKFTITTPSELTSQDVIFTGKNNVIGEVVITEGDTTGIEYDFFEGMNDVVFDRVSATGKNLFNKNETKIGFFYDEAEIIENYHTLFPCLKTKNLKPKTKYTASSSYGLYIAFFDKNENCIGSFNTESSKVFTTPNNTYYTLLRPHKGLSSGLAYNSLDEFNNDIQIEEGTTATSYEPYKGVTIEQSIDSIPLTSDMFGQGNLDGNNVVKGMSYQQNPIINGANRICAKTLIKVKPNSTYVLQNNSNINMWAMLFDENGGYIKNGNLGNSLTTDANTYYIGLKLQFTDNSNITPSTLDSLNLTLQEVTDEIVLRSIGDVKDTLNLTTGEYVQRIGEVVLNGDCGGYWALNSTIDVGYQYTWRADPINLSNKTNMVLCDKLSYSMSITLANVIWIYNGTHIVIHSTIDNLTDFKTWLSSNPLTIQYVLATPIIKKVNLTNTTKLPSYASTTHYDTIVPSNSLVPNIKIPSTIDYNVAIKPSTQYIIRANTTSAMSVDLGGSVGTLANGKVTLTTPSTLAHNSLKLGNGKAKEVMVIEGNEIKDNVPFFNGMKNVQMGGIKLVNLIRNISTYNGFITISADKRTITYTDTGYYGNVNFDSYLLKPNTLYTLYFKITQNTSTINMPCGIDIDGNAINPIVGNGGTGTFKVAFTSLDKLTREPRFVFKHSTNDSIIKVQDLMLFEGDWTHLDEIPFIESEMIIEQPIIRSQGKNLFDAYSLKGQSGSIPTIENIGVAEYKITTTTSNQYNAGNYVTIKMKKGETLTFSGSIKNIINARIFKNNNFFESANDRVDYTATDVTVYEEFSISRTATEDCVFNCRFWINLNTSPNGYIKDIQIEKSSSKTTYEPFKQHTLSSNRVIGYEENCYYANGGGVKDSNTEVNSMLADVEGLSIAYIVGGSSNYTFWDKDDVFISGKQYLDTSLSSFDKNGFITVPSNAKYMRFASGNETTNNAYKTATVTGELPLRSLPNGVCDSFNLVTGEYVQRIGEVVIDGSESWNKDTTAGGTKDNTAIFFTEANFNGFKPSPNVDYRDTMMLCDKFPVKARVYNLDEEGMMINQDGRIYIRINQSRLETVDMNGFKKFLSSNNVKVECELATPIVRKIGLTAKGNYKEVELNGREVWTDRNGATNNIKCTRYYISESNILAICPGVVENSPIIVDGVKERVHGVNAHGDYEYISFIKQELYYQIYKDKLQQNTATEFKKWLSQNPLKIGYLSSNSASLYSNIQKPIFFNNVKVQFMNDNVDIQPTLTLQARSRNSYVMDMMKANTVYTSKFWHNSYDTVRTRIDNTYMDMSKNGTFTSPSTLSNKLLITATGVQELMIIEGDVTSKQLPYYKGIRSSFDNTNEIEVLSQNKNLVKELYPMLNNNMCVIENGVITIKGDGDGSGELNCVFNPSIYLEQGKTYTFSFSSDAQFGKTNGTDTVEAFLLKDGGTGYYIETYGFTRTFAFGATGYYNIRLDINKNNTTHKFYNIQIEESPTATPYQQHKENSTIINMPMQLETVDVVKPVIEAGRILITDGQNDDNDTGSRRSKDYIPVEPEMILTFMNRNTYRAENIFLYDINKTYITKAFTNDSGSFIVPNNCYFIRFYSGTANTSDITVTKKQYKPIALNSLPNGVKDELIINRATSSAKLIRRVGKVVLDGSQAFSLHQNTKPEHKCNIYWMPMANVPYARATTNNAITDKLPYNDIGDKPCFNFLTSGFCYLKLGKDVELYSWLKQNPITVYYELEQPIITEIRLKGYPFVYEDGSITLNTDIAPVIKTSYNVNQHQLINSQNETIIRHDKQISGLYDYIEIYLDEIYRMELFKMQLELSL